MTPQLSDPSGASDPLPCIHCGKRADQLHHAIYQAELRRVAGRDNARFQALRSDQRNMVPLCLSHHERHHARIERLPLACLPDSVYDFALEVLGAGRAYNYLHRTCSGQDVRLDALLIEALAA